MLNIYKYFFIFPIYTILIIIDYFKYLINVKLKHTTNYNIKLLPKYCILNINYNNDNYNTLNNFLNDISEYNIKYIFINFNLFSNIYYDVIRNILLNINNNYCYYLNNKLIRKNNNLNTNNTIRIYILDKEYENNLNKINDYLNYLENNIKESIPIVITIKNNILTNFLYNLNYNIISNAELFFIYKKFYSKKNLNYILNIYSNTKFNFGK